MACKDLSVAIVGGGIGGVAAALSLLRIGCDVHLFEQAAAFIEAGAGIQITPNASRILRRLLAPATLDAQAVRPVAAHQRRWDDGRTLLRLPLGATAEAAFGAPYYNFHRADLLTALAGALPAERIHLGHRFAGLTDHGDRVEARFANGSRIEADLLVGADGIHSAVRSTLFGPQQARFTGCVAYRALVPAERLAHLGLEVTTNLWLGPERHFIHYFVAGGRLVYFSALDERSSWTGESWTDRGRIGEVMEAFAQWHSQVRGIISAADETFVWALFDRAPLARWSVGRVTLLGDACHAMLPFMAQGAAQAIEDGAALAACLADAGDRSVADTLRRYEAARLPRTTRLQEMSYANKTRYHLPDGELQQERDAKMAGRGRSALDGLRWLFGHDAAILAAKT
jgi:salicylate hydroxylase